MKSLGIVIYPDGSMSEVIQVSACKAELSFVPIPQRRLLQAPFETGRPESF